MYQKEPEPKEIPAIILETRARLSSFMTGEQCFEIIHPLVSTLLYSLDKMDEAEAAASSEVAGAPAAPAAMSSTEPHSLHADTARRTIAALLTCAKTPEFIRLDYIDLFITLARPRPKPYPRTHPWLIDLCTDMLRSFEQEHLFSLVTSQIRFHNIADLFRTGHAAFIEFGIPFFITLSKIMPDQFTEYNNIDLFVLLASPTAEESAHTHPDFIYLFVEIMHNLGAERSLLLAQSPTRLRHIADLFRTGHPTFINFGIAFFCDLAKTRAGQQLIINSKILNFFERIASSSTSIPADVKACLSGIVAVCHRPPPLSMDAITMGQYIQAAPSITKGPSSGAGFFN